jgi:hypothetical protein
LVQQDLHSTKKEVKSEDPEKDTIIVAKEEFSIQEQNALDLVLGPLEGSSQGLALITRTIVQDVCFKKCGDVGSLRSCPDCKVFNVSGSTKTIAFTNEPGQHFSIPLTLLTTLPHPHHAEVLVNPNTSSPYPRAL